MNAPYAATTPAHCDSIGLRRAEKAKGVDRSSTVIAKEPEGSFHPLSLSLHYILHTPIVPILQNRTHHPIIHELNEAHTHTHTHTHTFIT